MIFVFKTSVQNENQINDLSSSLNKLLKDAQWNFDLDDGDKILRIDCQAEVLDETIRLLQTNGFDCQEL